MGMWGGGEGQSIYRGEEKGTKTETCDARMLVERPSSSGGAAPRRPVLRRRDVPRTTTVSFSFLFFSPFIFPFVFRSLSLFVLLRILAQKIKTYKNKTRTRSYIHRHSTDFSNLVPTREDPRKKGTRDFSSNETSIVVILAPTTLTRFHLAPSLLYFLHSFSFHIYLNHRIV